MNMKFVNSRTSAKIGEYERGNGLFLYRLLHFHSDHWYIHGFQRNNIDVLINNIICVSFASDLFVAGTA